MLAKFFVELLMSPISSGQALRANQYITCEKSDYSKSEKSIMNDASQFRIIYSISSQNKIKPRNRCSA
jgi:hypothetical protein